MATPITATPEWNPASVDGPAALSAALTHLEKYAIPRFANAAARDAVITAPIKGQVAALDDSGGSLWVYSGTAWKKLAPQTTVTVTGTVTVSFSAASSATAAVTFPAGVYSVAPILSPNSTNSQYAPFVSGTTTTSGGTVGLRRIDGTSVTVSVDVTWVAVGSA